jgi:pimeloyl-ACP methyl ester carboxylesterase
MSGMSDPSPILIVEMPDLPLPTHHVHRLGDGRRVGYALYGDPDGLPVLNCHGGLLSRNDIAPVHADACRLGARLVSIDRPGVGLSDRHVGHAMCDWVADDVTSVLASLRVDRFSVMGWSLGGQYALAVAHVVPDRVERVALLAGCLPLDDRRRLAELNRVDRRFAALSDRRPWAARAAFGVLHGMARYAPSLTRRLASADLPVHEAAAVRAQGAWLPRTMEEGVRNGPGVIDEYRAMVSPWGFDPAAVTAPVAVHQGSADTLVPESWGRELADRLGNATFHLHPGDGHMIGLTKRAEVLAAFMER